MLQNYHFISENIFVVNSFICQYPTSEILILFADCQGPLKCFQRSGDEDVPGCIASEVLSEALPEIDIDESVGNNKGAAAYGRCQGGEYMYSPY